MPKNSYGTPLGPKPGSKARAKAKNATGLGRSLVNERTKSKKSTNAGDDRYTTDTSDEPNWVKLRSVTQERALDDFLSTAELADTDFTTERNARVRILSNPSSSGIISKEDQSKLEQRHQELSAELTVPRRPKWTPDMTRHELDRLEKDAFLDWRRGLAMLQENQDLLLTPFERNIEVWRQLWRVVDRSDLVVQIVDARNPLFFRSQDLENYVKESDGRKKNLLLINKSDLLTLDQRKAWAEYLTEKEIRYAFFSASTALREVESDDDNNNINNKDEQDNEEKSSENSESDDDIYDKEPEQESESINGNYAIMNSDPTRVLTVDQLEELFLSEAPEPLNAEDRIQIGLVGYPNVGKSSTINALIGTKKVSVSSTPGKTKHFQTILLTPKVMLCDCPGLVFPNFASTNAELVCNGVLPIDQLREHTSPVNLVTLRIPKFFLEAIYGISIHTRPVDEGGDGMPTAEELLVAYARARGFMRSGQGSPDESRAARFILKDYVNAKLLYCQPPPNYGDSEQFNSQLYKYSALPEARRNQIFTAIKSSRPGITESDLDSIDLATELSNLKFSQHDPTTSMLSPYGIAANSSALLPDLPTAGGDLDKEFFAQRQNNGITSLPFHLKNQLSGNSKKKHFKMNKNKKKSGGVSYDY